MNVILFHVAWIWIRVPAPTPYTIIMWITAGTPVFPSIKKKKQHFQLSIRSEKSQAPVRTPETLLKLLLNVALLACTF